MEDCAHAFHGWVQVLEKQTKAKQISPSAHESITSSHARAPICGAQASCPFIIPQLTRKYILIVKKDVYHLQYMGKKSCRHFVSSPRTGPQEKRVWGLRTVWDPGRGNMADKIQNMHTLTTRVKLENIMFRERG